jgi:hypothetical protein
MISAIAKKRLELLNDDARARKVTNNFPIEMHFDLLKAAFDTKKYQMFSELLNTAIKRTNFRRVEVPYITDIDFEVSNDIDVNVRNGYEKIPIDLNEAYLKQEITKLRNKKTEKEGEEGADEGKNKSKANAGKDKKKESKAAETDETDDTVVTHTKFTVKRKELEKVEHQFTYMILKRSSNPQNAIFNVEIVIADEETGPVDYIRKGWKCIAIPINQYTGIRATYHTVPYLCYQQSKTNLTDEREKMSLLIDIKPMISKSPLIRAEYGYSRIDVDLRQVPKNFIKMSNIDYVFVQVRTDKHFYSTEKLIYIFDNIQRLEATLNKQKIASEQDEAKHLLQANFGDAELREFGETLKSSLEGPIGEQVLKEEYDMLFKVSFFVWKTYISPVLVQIDHYYYLRTQREVLPEETRYFEEIIGRQLKPAFIDMLQIFIKIVTSNEYEQDVLWVCKMGLELGKLLEEAVRFKEAAQILRYIYDKICAYRDEKLARRLKSRNDLILPFSITCNNLQIEAMIGDMRESYYRWKLGLERTIRRIVSLPLTA